MLDWSCPVHLDHLVFQYMLKKKMLFSRPRSYIYYLNSASRNYQMGGVYVKMIQNVKAFWNIFLFTVPTFYK